MRIKSIQLSWFRGAAELASLDADCRSMVVYGENGAGKSSFVDGIEYVLHRGRIGHLAHEYSGKHQERAIPNTHTPEGQLTKINIKFKDNTELAIIFDVTGTSTISSAQSVAMDKWDYHRTVLRQDEVAAFINDTKGEKYSTLLPLLGLSELEVQAENVRQLAKVLTRESKLAEKHGMLAEIGKSRAKEFGGNTDAQITKEMENLYSKYCLQGKPEGSELPWLKELETVLDQKIAQFSPDQKQYLSLRDVAEVDLKQQITAIHAMNANLVAVVEPLIAEKINVLQSTQSFVEKLKDEGNVECPACGRLIEINVFKDHVKLESTRLEELIDAFRGRQLAMGNLSDSVKSLKTAVGKKDLREWRDQLAKGELAQSLGFIVNLSPEQLRISCSDADLESLQKNVVPIINEAASASAIAPANVQELLSDRDKIRVAEVIIEAQKMSKDVSNLEATIGFLEGVEHGIREVIKQRSQNAINEISADILTMWGILHPGEAIEDVSLYIPSDTEKAIDIKLKFHGVDQDSPRLTLSEGYKNSLGLCIFLAMAQREAKLDHPLFLDDVVISLDRNHRGMIAELLQKLFSDRQVIILTHDRDWYTELRQQLDPDKWIAMALLPYETPTIGIRWSRSKTSFDDARVLLKDRPDSAGNDARKIMDVELALISERLKIDLPYMHGHKNDKRMAHEFLCHIIGAGKKCFRRRVEGAYQLNDNAIRAFDEADKLLISWGNRASHSFDVVRAEATKLIDSCEEALEAFRCVSCKKYVWFADAQNTEWVQCQCGEIRWIYGNA